MRRPAVPTVVKVSLCMITKNEEANLPRVLKSVAGAVDEIIVGDTGSTDRTAAIAKRAGARVLHIVWENHFSNARNTVIDAATHDWVMILDADEELPAGFATKLREVLATTTADALSVTCENRLPDTEIAQVSKLPTVRIFRNVPGHRYENAIHEQISPAILRAGGRIEHTSLRIVHHGYKTAVAQGKGRIERNAAILENQLRAAPNDPWLHFHMGMTAKAAANHEKAEHHLQLALAFDEGRLGRADLARISCTLAQIALGAKLNAEAAAHATRSLELEESLLARHLLALATIFGGDPRASVPHFEAVRRSPECNANRHAELDQLIAFARRAA